MEQPEFTTDRIPGLRPGEIALDYHCIDEDDDEEQQASTLLTLPQLSLPREFVACARGGYYIYLPFPYTCSLYTLPAYCRHKPNLHRSRYTALSYHDNRTCSIKKSGK